VDLVRLELDLERTSDYPTYRAVIRTAEGDQVWVETAGASPPYDPCRP
jgi:hypothetical protein